MLDGAELPGTFGLDLSRIVFVIAGGAARAYLIDGAAEDDREAAAYILGADIGKAAGADAVKGEVDDPLPVLLVLAGPRIGQARAVHLDPAADRLAETLPVGLGRKVGVAGVEIDAPAVERVRQQLSGLPEPPSRPRLTKAEWLGGGGVFLRVFLITLPLAVIA